MRSPAPNATTCWDGSANVDGPPGVPGGPSDRSVGRQLAPPPESPPAPPASEPVWAPPAAPAIVLPIASATCPNTPQLPDPLFPWDPNGRMGVTSALLPSLTAAVASSSAAAPASDLASSFGVGSA